MPAKKKAKEPPAGGEAKPKRTRKKKAAELIPRGLGAADVLGSEPSNEARALSAAIASDGGTVLSVYREPLGGHWAVLAALPIERVAPTPFQRDLSEAHVGKLADVMGRLERFLDPIIAIRNADGV